MQRNGHQRNRTRDIFRRLADYAGNCEAKPSLEPLVREEISAVESEAEQVDSKIHVFPIAERTPLFYLSQTFALDKYKTLREEESSSSQKRRM